VRRCVDLEHANEIGCARSLSSRMMCQADAVQGRDVKHESAAENSLGRLKKGDGLGFVLGHDDTTNERTHGLHASVCNQRDRQRPPLVRKLRENAVVALHAPPNTPRENQRVRQRQTAASSSIRTTEIIWVLEPLRRLACGSSICPPFKRPRMCSCLSNEVSSWLNSATSAVARANTS
jgi:hypothetical protein